MDSVIKHAVEKYRLGSPIMTDKEFDDLVEKHRSQTERDSTHKLISVDGTKNSVMLPVPMASLNKIKKDPSAELKRWNKRHGDKHEYVVSCKLDGVSGLYSFTGGCVRLYTRGNGEKGFDITHLLRYIPIDKDTWDTRFHSKKFAIRGEFIIPVDNFKTMAKLRNKTETEVRDLSRNIVAGLINTTKEFSEEEMKLIQFVGYEFVDMCDGDLNTIKSSEQMTMLKDHAPFPCVQYTIRNNINIIELQRILREWSSNKSSYIIDGLVCRINKGYTITQDNPKTAFAFKNDGDLGENTTVTHVSWNISKDHIMKPVVHFKPVKLSGAMVSKCTGFNGSYIKNHSIGPSAIIRVKRSGSVIPTIIEIINKGEYIDLPSSQWEWDENGTEIIYIPTDNDNNVEQTLAVLKHFVKQLGIKGLGPASIRKLIVEKNIDTNEKLMKISQSDLEEVLGKNGIKVYSNINKTLRSAPLQDIVAACGLFGRNVGKKVVRNIIQKYGNVFKNNNDLDNARKNATTKTDISFLNHIESFNQWLVENSLGHLITGEDNVEERKIDSTSMNEDTSFLVKLIADFKDSYSSGNMKRNSFAITGKRNKEWISVLENHGLRYSNSVNSKTYALLTDDMNSTSSKMKKANKDKNVRIYIV